MQHRWLWLPCFLWLTFLLLCGGTSCKSLSPTQEKTVPAPSAPLTEERVVGKMEKSEEDSPLPAELFNVTESLKKAFCLKPGDEIEIRVFGRGDLTLVTVIPPDGTISFPLVGQVKVADVSPQEIERRVEETLKEKELVDPQVSVLVRNYAPRKAYMLGEVRNSGGYPIPAGEPLTLTQLLSLAGGFSQDADRKSIRLIRLLSGEKKAYTFSFARLQKNAESGQDIPLLPGDVVIVGKTRQVYVLGCVNKPGGYNIGEGTETLTKIIAQAGGLTRIAARSSIRVLRSEEEGRLKIIRIDIEAVFEGKLMDPQLKEGDVIYVPESLF